MEETGQLISLVFIAFLSVAAVCCYVFYIRKISAINGEIEKMIDRLNTEQEFEDIKAEFKKHDLLLPVWKIFEKSLTIRSNEACSTIDAAEIFSPQNLTRGMNMTFWQNYGGIFTGLGILGTFAGLTFGLSDIDMTSGDIEVLKDGIKNLLSGVKSAFVTSLVGIGCAILYSVVHHWLMKNFQGNLQTLADKLDEKFPRRSAEDWLADNNRIISDQTNSIKDIGETITQAIYDGLDEKLGEAVEKLNPLVDKICAAIENLGSDGAARIGEIFSNSVGNQMDRFSAALDNFSNSIDEKLKTADEISKIMNEQLLNTLKELSDNLNQQSKTSAEERTAEYQKFSDALANLIKTLQDVADKIKIQQENSAKGFETLVKNALDNFNAIMAQMLKDAQDDRKKDDDKRKVDAKQNQDTNEQFLATLAGLTETLQNVATKIEKQQADSIDNFDVLIENLIEKLDKFTDQQKDYLSKTADTNATQISQAVKKFREIVDAHNQTTQKMLAQVQNRLYETEKFLQQVNTAGNSLKQAAEPVKQSTLQLTKNLSETAAQMNTLANANRVTRENLSDLAARLSTFVNNFNGIADELERSTKSIHDSLDNYNVKTNTGLQEKLATFDKSMNKAFGYLNEIVEELSVVAEDLKQMRRR